MEVNFMKAVCCLTQMENRSFSDLITNNLLNMELQLAAWSGKGTAKSFRSVKNKAHTLLSTLKRRDERKTYPVNFKRPRAPWFSCAFYVIFMFSFTVFCYAIMDWDQGLLASTIALSNQTFRNSYQMQRINSDICLYAVSTVTNDPLFRIEGFNSQRLAAQIGSTNAIQDLPTSFFSFNEKLNKYIDDVSQYNLCSLNRMQEFSQIIEACRVYYPDIKIVTEDQLSIREQDADNGVNHKAFPFPDPQRTNITNIFGLNLMVLNAMIKNSMAQSLSQITSGQLSGNSTKEVQVFVEMVLKSLNWIYYSIDFIHHCIVRSSGGLLVGPLDGHQLGDP